MRNHHGRARRGHHRAFVDREIRHGAGALQKAIKTLRKFVEPTGTERIVINLIFIELVFVRSCCCYLKIINDVGRNHILFGQICCKMKVVTL